ncbi:MAG TPA: hypothetical protein VFV38_20475 [Ktedonobacteraceae bacterium]|nr:hypothetical protein [Ktedonobacteraceae bacterium]
MARSSSPRWLTAVVILMMVGLAAFLIWGLIQIWLLFWNYVSHSDPTVGAAIIALSGTILVSVLSAVLARFFEKRKELAIKHQEIEHEIREKHIPTYQELVQFLFKLFLSSKTGTPLSEEEMNNFFTDFTQKVLVWGSDRFIRDFSNFRETIVLYAKKQHSKQAVDADLTKTMLALEILLYSIRADCGHGNKGLGKGDLLTFFIKDVRNYIPKESVGVNNSAGSR